MPRRSVVVRILQVVSLVATGVLFVALIAAAFFNDGRPLSWLAPKGPAAQSILDITWPVFLVAGVVFFGVLLGTLFIAAKFRERDTDDPDEFPAQIHGRTTLEIGWTILPALILAGVAVATVITILELEQRKEDAIKVEVFGQQFWWGFRYDLDGDGTFDGEGDLITANELVVPVGREVDLKITSNDVIHSFWIPTLNGKKDAVPGQVTTIKIEASEEGTFLGQCTEFCGLSHANMRMLVRAVDNDTYDRWVENQLTDHATVPTDESAASGREVFTAQCAQCHTISGLNDDAEDPPPLVAGIAPDLTHFMTRGTFAGSIFNLYAAPGADPQDAGGPAVPGDPGDALTGGTVDTERVNRTVLEAWLRNPPAMKPAAPDDGRGMPNLALTEEQIDDLVEFLYTLN